MTAGVSIAAVGHASSLFLAVTYTLCVVFDLLFPQHAMYTAWEKLLPGFTWISWGAYFIGLIESYLYGWYLAVVWVPLYRLFAARAAR
ncbi:MAG TPA: DUF5676 family membrane protein [Acidiferrobacterales bacterium]